MARGGAGGNAVPQPSSVMTALRIAAPVRPRAFNSITYTELARDGYHRGELYGIELAADDPEALAVVKRLVTDAGFEPVVVGGLSSAKKFDQGAPVYPKAMLASDMRAALSLK